MIKALIFDFDGLIVETEGPIYQSWLELYQSYGFDLPLDSWVTIIGTSEFLFNPYEELERLAGGRLDWEVIEAQRRQREYELVCDQPVLPGVRQLLEEGRTNGIKIGLASSSPAAWVTGHLERLGLQAFFDVLRTREDVRATKPDPALFLSAMQALNVSGSQAVALEDSHNGVVAARRAGMYCVAVPTALTRTLPLEEAHLRLDSLAQMPFKELMAYFNRLPGP